MPPIGPIDVSMVWYHTNCKDLLVTNKRNVLNSHQALEYANEPLASIKVGISQLAS